MKLQLIARQRSCSKSMRSSETDASLSYVQGKVTLPGAGISAWLTAEDILQITKVGNKGLRAFHKMSVSLACTYLRAGLQARTGSHTSRNWMLCAVVSLTYLIMISIHTVGEKKLELH